MSSSDSISTSRQANHAAPSPNGSNFITGRRIADCTECITHNRPNCDRRWPCQNCRTNSFLPASVCNYPDDALHANNTGSPPRDTPPSVTTITGSDAFWPLRRTNRFAGDADDASEDGNSVRFANPSFSNEHAPTHPDARPLTDAEGPEGPDPEGEAVSRNFNPGEYPSGPPTSHLAATVEALLASRAGRGWRDERPPLRELPATPPIRSNTHSPETERVLNEEEVRRSPGEFRKKMGDLEESREYEYWKKVRKDRGED